MQDSGKICRLLDIDLPIVQGGMVWVSGAKLAAAVSNAGGLGLIGAGSMAPDLLERHILKAKSLTPKPIGVNLPLLYSKVEDQIEVCLRNGIRIFFTSAGSPKKYTQALQQEGATVVHVTSSPELAIKCRDAGCDAIVAEGFEAGGHNGRDEITTMALIPQVVKAVDIPVIAAGGIGTGGSIAAAFAMGASGVQIGTLFAATKESSAHASFKQAIVEAVSGSTRLCMKKHVPVRLLLNEFAHKAIQLEEHGAGQQEIQDLLGKGRAKKGMLEGDLKEGELEIGQISALVRDVPSVEQLLSRLIDEYKEAVSTIPKMLR